MTLKRSQTLSPSLMLGFPCLHNLRTSYIYRVEVSLSTCARCAKYYSTRFLLGIDEAARNLFSKFVTWCQRVLAAFIPHEGCLRKEFRIRLVNHVIPFAIRVDAFVVRQPFIHVFVSLPREDTCVSVLLLANKDVLLLVFSCLLGISGRTPARQLLLQSSKHSRDSSLSGRTWFCFRAYPAPPPSYYGLKRWQMFICVWKKGMFLDVWPLSDDGGHSKTMLVQCSHDPLLPLPSKRILHFSLVNIVLVTIYINAFYTITTKLRHIRSAHTMRSNTLEYYRSVGKYMR